MSPAPDTSGHRRDLLRAFRIGPDDLTANRAGRLGERQRQILVRSGWLVAAGSLALGVALVTTVLLGAERPFQPIQWILTAGLAAAALAGAAAGLTQARAAVADGGVERLTGPVRVTRQARAGVHLHVQDRSHVLPVAPRHVLAGAVYHVYVAPRAKRIVAMEPAWR